MTRRLETAATRVAWTATWAVLFATACSEPPPPRNAVLILVDSMRADRLSSYGYPVETSPNLDALAEQGVLFETTVSHAAWTLPAMAAIFTGHYPTRETFDSSLRTSLVEKIASQGIRTAAILEGGFVSEHFGFGRGFEQVHDGSRDSAEVSIEDTFESASAWLRENHAERFFLLVHTYEPRLPFTRRTYTRGLDSGRLGRTFTFRDAERVRKREIELGPVERSWVRALYDGGITASDRQVGRLLATLEELGIRDETAVIVTSDHGEDIGGRDPEWPGIHGNDLYDESLLVPLIVHDPSRKYEVRRVRTQVRTIDVLHTVIDLLGLPPTPGLLGRSLVPVMHGTETAHRIAWSTVPRQERFGHARTFAVRDGTHKLIMTPLIRGRLHLELYDLASDPGERANTAQEDPRNRVRLFKALTGTRDGLRRSGRAQYRLDGLEEAPVVAARLRALGAVDAP